MNDKTSPKNKTSLCTEMKKKTIHLLSTNRKNKDIFDVFAIIFTVMISALSLYVTHLHNELQNRIPDVVTVEIVQTVGTDFNEGLWRTLALKNRLLQDVRCNRPRLKQSVANKGAPPICRNHTTTTRVIVTIGV